MCPNAYFSTHSKIRCISFHMLTVNHPPRPILKLTSTECCRCMYVTVGMLYFRIQYSSVVVVYGACCLYMRRMKSEHSCALHCDVLHVALRCPSTLHRIHMHSTPYPAIPCLRLYPLCLAEVPALLLPSLEHPQPSPLKIQRRCGGRCCRMDSVCSKVHLNVVQ